MPCQVLSGLQHWQWHDESAQVGAGPNDTAKPVVVFRDGLDLRHEAVLVGTAPAFLRTCPSSSPS